MTELCFETATSLVRRMAAGELSCVEVLEAHLAQIARLNPRVNAICTLTEESARESARALDESVARGEPSGALHGLPIAVKDLELTKGVRTTFGSPIYADYVPDRDALFVERLKAAGAVLIGKTNTPEFGAGSSTFNPVFGRTRNPYGLDKTCGGSSGGAAVALACGMIAVADGSDLGGSVRNPPSFCNVVGLRPSPGRIPRWPCLDPWESLNVLGPLGRTVEDVALLLSVMAGSDPRDPLSFDPPGTTFTNLDGSFEGLRVAWSPDLGSFPVQRDVLRVLEPTIRIFEELGCEVDTAHPDFSGAHEIFQTLRAHMYAKAHGQKLAAHRDRMKDAVVWNIEKGLALSGTEIARAELARAELQRRVAAFLDRYDFLLLPVAQVTPFDVEQAWVTEIEGVDARDVYRLDGELFLHFADRASSTRRARRFHGVRPPRRTSNRRSIPGGARRPEARARVPRGDRRISPPPADLLTPESPGSKVNEPPCRRKWMPEARHSLAPS